MQRIEGLLMKDKDAIMFQEALQCCEIDIHSAHDALEEVMKSMQDLAYQSGRIREAIARMAQKDQETLTRIVESAEALRRMAEQMQMTLRSLYE